MGRILLLSGHASAADRERCRGLAGFLRRRARVEAEAATAEVAPPQDEQDEKENARPGSLAAALLRLAGTGRLSYAEAPDGTWDVLYTASREASRSVRDAGPSAAFPEAVQKKHAAAFRSSEGALLRFPVESGEGTVEKALEVFITDWSPCPAAAAVAIHRAHPFAADLAKAEGPFFTGRYVRHPLTGDLLPVWVADWVRPDFGTGAVLVNPAHDATDLAFGRAVGLPIRFALAPAGFDGSPATWPQPPVVKTGQTIRTGPYDGLSPAEAVIRYFEVMAERGLAERYRDIQAGRWQIGRLVSSAEGAAGDLAWHPVRHALLPAGAAESGALAVDLTEADLLAAAVALAEGPAPVLVCPAGEQAGELLALRLLAFDLAGGPAGEPAVVHLVQKVQESKMEAPPEVTALAALLSAPLQQVAVVKQQTVEQIQRFLRVHRELVEAPAEAGEPGAAGAPDTLLRALGKVKAAVSEGDPAKAFSLLAQTQKQLRDLSTVQRSGALPGYCVLAGVVAGLEVPAGMPAAAAWSQIP
jgi:hypothetical protein